MLRYFGAKYAEQHVYDANVTSIMISRTRQPITLYAGLFKLRELKRICLSDFIIRNYRLPELLFTGISELIMLSVTYMNVNSIRTQYLNQLYMLEFLNFSHNSLYTISQTAFQMTSSLVVLDLSFNKINETESNVFIRLEKLRELHLQRNLLTYINASILTGLDRLQLLDLSCNRIFRIGPDTIASLGSLRRLYLEDNRMTSLVELTFRYVMGLDVITVGRNEIVCDCDLFWLSRLSYQKIQKFRYSHADETRSIICYDTNASLDASIYKLSRCRKG